jgi:hypothetical protein
VKAKIGSILHRAGVLAAITCAALVMPAHAHHSLAMYDGIKTVIVTGVVTRVSPGASHVLITFAPLDAERKAVLRNDKKEPVLWSLELTAAAQAASEGITVAAFPAGTIISAGLHPLRSGDGGGTREGALYKCPPNTPPAAGKHCDSVEGSTMHGRGGLPVSKE